MPFKNTVPLDIATKWFQENVDKIIAIDKKITALQDQRKMIAHDVVLTAEYFKRLRDQDPKRKLPRLEMPPELVFNPRYARTLGDAIEALLKVEGVMTRKAILASLIASGVRIGGKNAFIIVSNAIKR